MALRQKLLYQCNRLLRIGPHFMLAVALSMPMHGLSGLLKVSICGARSGQPEPPYYCVSSPGPEALMPNMQLLALALASHNA